MACNSYSRTNYYEEIYLLFSLPAIIVVYITFIRGCLWALRPFLTAMPLFKDNEFFAKQATETRSALCFDVRTAMQPRGLALYFSRARPYCNMLSAAGYDWVD